MRSTLYQPCSARSLCVRTDLCTGRRGLDTTCRKRRHHRRERGRCKRHNAPSQAGGPSRAARASRPELRALRQLHRTHTGAAALSGIHASTARAAAVASTAPAPRHATATSHAAAAAFPSAASAAAAMLLGGRLAPAHHTRDTLRCSLAGGRVFFRSALPPKVGGGGNRPHRVCSRHRAIAASSARLTIGLRVRERLLRYAACHLFRHYDRRRAHKPPVPACCFVGGASCGRRDHVRARRVLLRAARRKQQLAQLLRLPLLGIAAPLAAARGDLCAPATARAHTAATGAHGPFTTTTPRQAEAHARSDSSADSRAATTAAAPVTRQCGRGHFYSVYCNRHSGASYHPSLGRASIWRHHGTGRPDRSGNCSRALCETPKGKQCDARSAHGDHGPAGAASVFVCEG
mmetsp:Transcript_12471/g.32697  ORF Transcript_12471/g.32697 Transcript_12471/m.32697 type:complete len:404 (-) Transcript_12471:115-1326(-)